MARLDYFEFQNYLREKVKDFSLIKKMTSVALGYALGRSLPLPSSGVDNVGDYYIASIRPSFMQEANDFNEQILIDLDQVEQVTRIYWLKRYATAYPSRLIPLSSEKDAHFMAKLSGTTALINPELKTFCDENAELLIVLINRITQLINPQ